MIPANVRPGDFGLTTISGGVGKAIRFGQWLNGDGFANYEHAFVYVDNGNIVEAEPGGARFTPLHYDNVMWSSGLIAVPDHQRFALVQAAMSYVGIPYSELDYFSLAAKRLRLPVAGLDAYIASTGHMICSQLVAACYRDAGIPLFKCWTGDVTPGDLWQLLNTKRGHYGA